jgi:hypothetical protein
MFLNLALSAGNAALELTQAWTLHQQPENQRNSQPLGRRFGAKVMAAAIA